jgi:hypothetical protein
MKLFRTIILALLALSFVMPAMADGNKMKPFVLASKGNGDLKSVAANVKGKLTAAGFQVAGEYSPYDTVSIIAFTNDALKNAAAASEYGAYAAAQRVSVTNMNGQIQVAYTNPAYFAQAYQLSQDLADVRQQLAGALGDMGEFGPKEGMDAEDLRDYHYMFGMPYLDEPDTLAEYDSYEDAVAAVEKGLAEHKGGVSKVYSIKLPGDKTLYGVAMTKGKSSDKYIMSEIDFKDIRSTAHLPYEMLVDGKKVYALRAEFRIAIDFPDLKMMGANSFMNIMSSPEAIKTALTKAAGGTVSSDDF